MSALCMLMACGAFEPRPLSPYGEALLVVDTDLPVPRVASRLRIDLYAADGTWFASRDDVRPDPRDWPVSFSVYADDESRGRDVLVRLRAYPDGRLSPYGGLTYTPLPDLLRDPPRAGNGAPRLLIDGTDRTPVLEPDPALTVDLVVRVRLEAGRRGRAHVVLRGACAGRQALLGQSAQPQTCTDGAAPLAPVPDAVLEESLSTDIASVTGTYGDEPCPRAPSSERVCVPGGAFVLGDAFYRSAGGSALEARPERIIRMTRFAIDRDEVTVGRFRAALARGFAAPRPVGVTERDGPPGSDAKACTFSAAPRGRERYALSCVAWVTADAFCRFERGALPTEAQWEYAALAALRPRKVMYPWGDDPPTCGRAVYGRSTPFDDCKEHGEGPAPVDDRAADVNALGVRNLAGSLEEHTADTPAEYRDACWISQPSIDPRCTRATRPECVVDADSAECRAPPGFDHTVRGGSWFTHPEELRGVLRGSVGAAAASPITGFRCVYTAP